VCGRLKNYEFTVTCQVVFPNIFWKNHRKILNQVAGGFRPLILSWQLPGARLQAVLGWTMRASIFGEKIRDKVLESWRFKTGPLFLALILQALLLAGTGFVVVFGGFRKNLGFRKFL